MTTTTTTNQGEPMAHYTAGFRRLVLVGLRKQLERRAVLVRDDEADWVRYRREVDLDNKNTADLVQWEGILRNSFDDYLDVLHAEAYDPSRPMVRDLPAIPELGVK